MAGARVKKKKKMPQFIALYRKAPVEDKEV